MVQVAEVQGRDEGALADEVDALKEAAAREAAERKALLEMEYERQHDEVSSTSVSRLWTRFTPFATSRHPDAAKKLVP